VTEETHNPNDIKTLALNLQSDDFETKLNAVTALKALLVQTPSDSKDFEELVDKIVSHEILEQLAEIIKAVTDFNLKYRAVWCFVNICCGNSTHITKAIDSGILDLVSEIIDKALAADTSDTQALDLAVEAIWLIGNVSGDSAEHRDACLEFDAANKIVQLVNKFPNHEKLLSNSVWTLQNLVCKKPAPFWNQISDAFKLFVTIIQNPKNETDLIYHALWGICYISSSYTLDVVSSGCIPNLVKFITGDEPKHILPALQTLGNLISTTRDHYTDEVLKNTEFVPTLFKLSESPHQKIKTYAVWCISNISAGTPEQIASIIDHPSYLDQINGYLKADDEKIVYQASFALSNLVNRATAQQIEKLVTKNNYLDGLLEILKQPNVRMYERLAVEPIHTIMKHDTKHILAPIFKNKGLIEQMQSVHPNMGYEMRTMTNDIITKHFLNIPAPVAASTTATTLNVPAATLSVPQTVSSPARSPSRSPSKAKVPKVESGKKIQKATKPKKPVKKAPIRKTKTMMETLKEAKALTKGVKGRTRKSSKPASLKKATGETPAKKDLKKAKIKRTGTMKQTLKEAKKILKQLDSAKKSK